MADSDRPCLTQNHDYRECIYGHYFGIEVGSGGKTNAVKAMGVSGDGFFSLNRNLGYLLKVYLRIITFTSFPVDNDTK
jgi:hypothetical protein